MPGEETNKPTTRDIHKLIDCQIRRDKDKCSLMFEGVNETAHLDIKTIIEQICFDAGMQLQEQDIAEAYRVGKTKEVNPD